MMSVCNFCGSLDFKEIFQEESRQLSWLSEDIAVLYNENSTLIENLKKLNLVLENMEVQPEFYDDTIEEDDVGATAKEVLELLHHENTCSLVKDTWLLREDYLRVQLVQQLQTLSQDLSTLQPQHHHPPHHHQHPHLPRYLWGHLSRKWWPPSSASTARARKRKKPERLLKWLERRMPMNPIELN